MLLIGILIVAISTCTENAVIKEGTYINAEEISKLQLIPVIVENEQPHLCRSKLLTRKKQIWNDTEVWGCGGTWRHNAIRKKESLVTATLAFGIEEDLQSTNANISVSEAYRIAKKFLKSENHKNRLYHPDDKTRGPFNKAIFIADRQSKAKLVYYFNILVIDQISNRFNVTNTFVMIDAETGEIVNSHDGLMSAAGKNFVDIYAQNSHNQNWERTWADNFVRVTKFNATHCEPKNRYASVSRPVTNGVYDFFFCDFVYEPFVVKCNPSITNVGSAEKEVSQIHDALFLATHFQKILKIQFNDTTLSDNCGQLRMCVEMDLPEFSFAINDQYCTSFYGSGGRKRSSMVAPTIVGHELGHAIMMHTSQLFNIDQSAAIQESFADLCGILLKASLNNYQTDWLFGSEVVRENSSTSAMRFMADPPRDGRSIDHAKDFRCKQDEHLMAGVYNKAIFNLSQMKGWHLQKIFQVFLRANNYVWDRLTGFDKGLCGLLKVVEDFDYNSEDVSDAFAKVGVFCGCPNGWHKRKRFSCKQNTQTSCYKVVEEQVNWVEALTHCESMKASLFTPVTEDSSNWVKTNLPLKRKHGYWLGATDLQSEGKWSWINEVSVSFKDWHDQPKSHPYKNCMALVKQGRKWAWSDERCSEKLSFICELV